MNFGFLRGWESALGPSLPFAERSQFWGGFNPPSPPHQHHYLNNTKFMDSCKENYILENVGKSLGLAKAQTPGWNKKSTFFKDCVEELPLPRLELQKNTVDIPFWADPKGDFAKTYQKNWLGDLSHADMKMCNRYQESEDNGCTHTAPPPENPHFWDSMTRSHSICNMVIFSTSPQLFPYQKENKSCKQRKGYHRFRILWSSYESYEATV